MMMFKKINTHLRLKWVTLHVLKRSKKAQEYVRFNHQSFKEGIWRQVGKGH